MKKSTAAQVATQAADVVADQPSAAASAPLVCILKVGTCPNLSESAKLGYMIGCTPESKVQLRVSSNSGSGYFSREWVSLDAVFKALDKCPKDKPLNAYWLGSLFAGKSINTPSFLMAVLLAEGLVKRVDRNYERLDPAGFVGEVKKLIEAGADLKVDDEPARKAAKPKAEPPIKKPARRASRTATTKA